MFLKFIFSIAILGLTINASNYNDDYAVTTTTEAPYTAKAVHGTSQQSGEAKAESPQELSLFFQFIQAYSVDGIEGQQPYKPGKPIADAVETLKKNKEKGKEKTIRNWFLQRAPKGGSDILKVFETFMGDELPEHQKKFLSVLTFASENNGDLKAISLQSSIIPKIADEDAQKRIICDYLQDFFECKDDFIQKILSPFAEKYQQLCLMEEALFSIFHARTHQQMLTDQLSKRFNHFRALKRGSTKTEFYSKTELVTENDFNAEIAKIYRMNRTDGYKNSYIDMLKSRKTNISFDGKTKLVTDDDFNAEIAKIYRELGTNDAKLDYMRMLEIRTAKISFDGKTKLVTDDDFNAEIAKIYRELGTHNAKSYYVFLLEKRTAKISFDGKTNLVTDDDFNAEIAKIYRELGTNDAK
jgi:hypothetical protein